MSDVTNLSNSGVFNSFGAIKSNSSISKPDSKSAQQTVVEKESNSTNIKQSKNNLEKAMPYIATGASAVAIGVSTAVAIKSGKNSKELLQKMTKLEQSMKNGGGNVVTQENIKSATSFVVGLLGAATGGAIVNHFDTNKDTLKKIGMTDEEIHNAKVKVEGAVLERENRLSRTEAAASDAIKRANEADGKAQNAENKSNCI